MAYQVRVYSAPACPWCKRAKRFLEDNDIPYENLDVSTSRAARDEMVERTSQLAVPVVDVDGEISIGFDENWLGRSQGWRNEGRRVHGLIVAGEFRPEWRQPSTRPERN